MMDDIHVYWYTCIHLYLYINWLGVFSDHDHRSRTCHQQLAVESKCRQYKRLDVISLWSNRRKLLFFPTGQHTAMQCVKMNTFYIRIICFAWGYKRASTFSLVYIVCDIHSIDDVMWCDCCSVLTANCVNRDRNSNILYEFAFRFIFCWLLLLQTKREYCSPVLCTVLLIFMVVRYSW